MRTCYPDGGIRHYPPFFGGPARELENFCVWSSEGTKEGTDDGVIDPPGAEEDSSGGEDKGDGVGVIGEHEGTEAEEESEGDKPSDIDVEQDRQAHTRHQPCLTDGSHLVEVNIFGEFFHSFPVRGSR